MNLVDANVLLYAVNTAEPRNDEARRWLDEALTGREPVGLPWIVLLAFLRLSTRIGLFPRPLEAPAALDIVRAWIDQPAVVRAEPTARHLDLLASLLKAAGTGGNLVSDAHLAALALEYDATIVTYDSDFARFAGVRHRRPG